MNKEQARELVEQFETCKLPKEKWTHEAHFVMALWYCSHLPLPQAVHTIREGIKQYNISIGGANTDHSGYHETITQFYTRLIINYIMKSGSGSHFEIRLNGLMRQPFLVKDYPLKFYTKELLMSKEARNAWVPPDIQSMD